MKKNFSFIVFLIISFSNITTVHSIEADVFVQSTVNRAAKTLGGNFSKEKRIQILKDIAKDTVDIDGLAFYSLGTHKKNLTKDQITDYKKVFEELSFFGHVRHVGN